MNVAIHRTGRSWPRMDPIFAILLDANGVEKIAGCGDATVQLLIRLCIVVCIVCVLSTVYCRV